MTTRRDFLRAGLVTAAAIVLPDEQFVRRFFPVGIDFGPRTFKVRTAEAMQFALDTARRGDTVLVEGVIHGRLHIRQNPRGDNPAPVLVTGNPALRPEMLVGDGPYASPGRPVNWGIMNLQFDEDCKTLRPWGFA